jgi:uncharacterized protein YyaL (SSP411 family)
MEHESFEDPEVARLMNEVFISIKVDREERPDIDKLYMSVCQMLTGSGGWPLTIIMTPDKKPFFAATYIPKETRFGRIGMVELVGRVKNVWSTKRGEILNSASQIVSSLRQSENDLSGDALDHTTLETAYEQLSQRFDSRHGGFGNAPKFPTPHNLSFLLHHWQRSGDVSALKMVETTLRAMRRGGIYDHVGYGFHRYSTDEKWLLPHFEKMIYDQALLAMAYLDAYRATDNTEYAETAREIFSYVLRDMTSPEGGFYSAEDADSEGVEGKFYLWTLDEIKQIFTKEESDVLAAVYNLAEDGNVIDEATRNKTGSNILHLTGTLQEVSSKLNLAEDELIKRLEEFRRKLFSVRTQRIHPHKDDKVLTDWNGLMIAAFAQGAQALNEPLYAGAAKNAADFILNTMRTPQGRLLHRYRDNQAAIAGNLDDYSFLVWGLLDLYETTFEVKYLHSALEFTNDMIAHFWDTKGDGFYFTPDDEKDLLVRQKDVYDGAVPSGNSVMMRNLLRLARITANTDFEKKASQIGQTFSRTVSQYPSAHTQLMCALDFALGHSFEIVIVGGLQDTDSRSILQSLRKEFVPNKVVLFRPSAEKSPEITRIAPFTKSLSSIDGKATIYICQDYQCSLPTTDIVTMRDLLHRKSKKRKGSRIQKNSP